MDFNSEAGKHFLQKEYVENERSLADIARECDSYPQKIRRALIRHGLHRRGHAEAQAVALKRERARPPMRGRTHTERTRVRISKANAENWEQKQKFDKDAHAEAARGRWQARRGEVNEAGHERLVRASHDGSSFEEFLLTHLRAAGHEVERGGWVAADPRAVRVDLLLRGNKVAVFVDGPGQHLPLWGAEELARRREKAAEDNRLLVVQGFSAVRVKNTRKRLPLYLKKDFSDQLLVTVEEARSVPQVVLLEVAGE